MTTGFILFSAAAFFEILGCYAFWLYFKMDKAPLWLGLGLASLVVFAYILTKIDVESAGRIYAIYGGIYIVASLVWMVAVEKEWPNRYDLIGSALALIGAAVAYVGNKNT